MLDVVGVRRGHAKQKAKDKRNGQIHNWMRIHNVLIRLMVFCVPFHDQF